MLILAALIGAVLCGGFVFGLLYLRQTPRAQVRRRILAMIERAEAERAINSRIKKDAEPEQIKKPALHKSFYVRIIKPALKWLEETLLLLTPSAITAMLERYIFRAGKQGVWSVPRLAMFWVLSVVAWIGLAFVFIQQTDFFLSQEFLILILGGVIGAIFPFVVLNSQIRQRQKKLKKQLPEFLDLLCVSVQAGLSFDGAVSKITSRMRNTLSDEFRHMQDDIKFGMTKQYALTQMAKRCDIEEIYLFTTSVIQAEKLGTSMAQTLSNQADNMRHRHRQFVRAQAMKASVKMLFPMVAFIFPGIFVVLLMPSIITMIKIMGK